MSTQTKKSGRSIQSNKENGPENQRPLNFMSLPDYSIIQNLWLYQPVHPQNIFPSILVFSHKYFCSKYHQHLVAVFQEQPSDIIMACHQTRGGVQEAKAAHCRQRRCLYRDAQQSSCQKTCICFHIFAAYLSLLSAFGTVLLICFHSNSSSARGERMCIYLIDNFFEVLYLFLKIWVGFVYN